MGNMGITLCCEKVESEEETISRILSNMTLAEIDTETVYKNFKETISISENKIVPSEFNSFLCNIVGDNYYSKV